MNYKKFLVLLSQLHCDNKGSLIAFGKILHLKKASTGYVLSTHLAVNEEMLPSYLREFFLVCKTYKWQSKGPYLHYDPRNHTLLLEEEILDLQGYLSFKKQAEAFVNTAAEWSLV